MVFDLSASMQAREAAGTRLDLARKRARALVDALRSTDEVMLVAAADRPRVALRWTSDHGRVRERLEALDALDVATDLVAALELALTEARVHPGVRIAVFTDLPPEVRAGAPGILGAAHWVQVGRTDDNAGIIALTVERPVFRASGDTTVTALVRNYARAPRDVVLEATVAGRSFARRRLRLGPRATLAVLLGGPPGSGELTVALAGGDALGADDRAFGWVPPDEDLELLLVTDAPEAAASVARIGAAVARARVDVIGRADWEAQRPARARTVVFDGVVPASAPETSALYVAPPAGNTVCPSLGTLERAAIVDWDAQHALLDGLPAPNGTDVGPVSQLATPAWGDAVVLAAAPLGTFPLLVAGERDGVRRACLGAALTASLTSSDDLPLLVLLLGTLRWLGSPPDRGAIAVRTGVAVPLPDGAPGGPAPAGLRVAGAPPVVVAERVGTYRVGPPRAERVVAANLFDDRESDIGRAASRAWPGPPPGPAPAGAPARHEFGRWLYLLAALLLALEWRVWAARAEA
jgi:hypothetical protein